MADNYLEKRFEDYRAQASSGHSQRKATQSLDRLLLRNRSYRGYDSGFKVRADQLRRIVEVNTKIPSARNQQVLRFRMVTAEEADKVLPHIRLGGALPQLNLPFPGTEPNAFVVICSTVAESRYVSIDIGISAQSMLLKAAEMGLNGICIGAFDREKITQALELPLEPLLIIAIGRGIENIKLTEIGAEEEHNYYRNNGTHYVPKVRAEELIIK